MSTYAVSTEFRAVDKMSAFFDRAARKADAFGQRVGKSLKWADEKLSKLAGAGTAIAAGTAAAGAGVAYLSTTGMEFEQVLANIRAVAKPTGDELQRMSTTALQVGADMGFSGVEVASAMEAMAKQGLTTQQVIAGIGGVAAAAAADGSTLEETMGGLLATMTGMGKGAGDLQHIADVMAKAGDSTAASIGSLSQSMAVFGPTARGLGIPLESAIGQLAILQDAGIDASSAGTTLSAVYSKLAAPMGRTKEALSKLGIEVADAMGNMKPPDQLMSEILGATSQIEGNVGKAAAMTELVGLESQKALQNVTAAVASGKFDTVMKDLTANVDGYAQSVAAVKMDSTRGDLKKFTAEIEAQQIALFGLVSGPMRGVLASSREWIQTNKELVGQRVQDTILWIRDNSDLVVTSLKVLGGTIGVFWALSAATKAAQVALATYELAVGVATVATNAFKWAFASTTATTEAGTVAITASKAATLASTIATGASTAAQWLWNTAIGAGTLATTKFTFSGVASKVATLASAAASGVATAAQWLWNAAITAGTGALGFMTTAATGAAASAASAAVALGPAIAAFGALAAAIGAAYVAKQQFDQLDQQLAGSGGVTGTIGAMWEQGTWDPFEAHDKVMNDKAREAARKRDAEAAATPAPQAVTQAGASAQEISRTVSEMQTQRAEVTVKAPVGSTVKKPAQGLTTVKLAPSGAP